MIKTAARFYRAHRTPCERCLFALVFLLTHLATCRELPETLPRLYRAVCDALPRFQLPGTQSPQETALLLLVCAVVYPKVLKPLLTQLKQKPTP